MSVLALLLLAPWAAECSWGGNTLDAFVPVALVLAPLYGGAAVLIRETARRTGGGWPAIVLLAAAFGVVQAGLVDQSLFNPGYLDDTEYAGLAAAAGATRVPGLGFTAEQAFDYVGNHIALSICAPIAIVESFVSERRRLRPWLGWRGLAAVAVLYALGSLFIFSDDAGRKGFLASPVQLLFAGSVALTLIGVAILPRFRHAPAAPSDRALGPAAASGRALGSASDRAPGSDPASDRAPGSDPASRRMLGPDPASRRMLGPDPASRRMLGPDLASRRVLGSDPGSRRAPGAIWVGLVALGAHLAPLTATGWPAIAIRAVAVAVAATVIVAWSRRSGWGQRHVLAGWSAGLLVAAAQAYVVPNYEPSSPAAALVGDVAVSVVVVALVGGAFWRLRALTKYP